MVNDIKTEIVEKDIKDLKGFTISKGTRLFILKETIINNPITKRTELFKVVKIDNGTEDLRLMTETCFKCRKDCLKECD